MKTALPPFLLVVLLATACSAAEPLSLEKLKVIIVAEHSEKPLAKALQVYPKARECPKAREWQSLFFIDGKLVKTEKGVATVTKR